MIMRQMEEISEMSVKSTKKTDANTYELEITADGTQFETAVQKAYTKAKNKINIPGFRRGKAPRSIIEKMYGAEVFYEDAVNSLAPQLVAEAVDELKITLVDNPGIEVTHVSKENGVIFKVTCVAKPEVEISDYKGIEVEKSVKTVSDEDIETELKHMQERNGRLVTVEDRAVANGDTVVIDFEGFMNQVPFDGGKENDYELKIGSGQFIPGFEEQIIGHNAGDEFSIDVTFPEKYQMPELAGKPAVFEIKLHEIKTLELPELDNEFAMDTSEFDTLDELKEDIKKNLEERAVRNADIDVENAIFEKLIEKMTADIPQVMFEHKIDDMIRDFESKLAAQGLDLEMYLSFTNMELPDFRKTFEEQAQKNVKVRLALEKIGELEGITVSNERMQEEVQKMSKAYKMPPQQIMRAISPANLRTDIIVTEAFKIVKDSAVIK